MGLSRVSSLGLQADQGLSKFHQMHEERNKTMFHGQTWRGKTDQIGLRNWGERAKKWICMSLSSLSHRIIIRLSEVYLVLLLVFVHMHACVCMFEKRSYSIAPGWPGAYSVAWDSLELMAMFWSQFLDAWVTGMYHHKQVDLPKFYWDG